MFRIWGLGDSGLRAYRVWDWGRYRALSILLKRTTLKTQARNRCASLTLRGTFYAPAPTPAPQWRASETTSQHNFKSRLSTLLYTKNPEPQTLHLPCTPHLNRSSLNLKFELQAGCASKLLTPDTQSPKLSMVSFKSQAFQAAKKGRKRAFKHRR